MRTGEAGQAIAQVISAFEEPTKSNRDKDKEDGFQAERRCRVEIRVGHNKNPENGQQKNSQHPKFPSSPHRGN